jgi:putative phosphoribosyl transferase
MLRQEVRVDAEGKPLAGDLAVPAGAAGIVLFAHGSGSSRRSPRNREVAGALQERGMGTLLLDLLTEEEERADARTGHLRFDIALLARRLAAATDWLEGERPTAGLGIGYFGASTGGGAALLAVAERPQVRGVVSRGGRPDLAGPALSRVTVPTLLIVGSRDEPVIAMNREAMARMGAAHVRLEIVAGASHLFEEPGALQVVARLAGDFLERCFSGG